MAIEDEFGVALPDDAWELTRSYGAVEELLDDAGAYAAMANAVNPYGDGRAAERSVAAIGELLGLDRSLLVLALLPVLGALALVPTLRAERARA